MLFSVCITIGYFTGFNLIHNTTSFSAQGIEQNLLGNDSDDSASVMKFKKSEREILTIIHTHIISFSLIFILLGTILLSLPIYLSLKKLLLFEPFISIILTFGSIWFIWKGFTIFKYVAMISGILLTMSFLLITGLISFHILRSLKSTKNL